jgi:hypothetical protein
MDTGHDSTCSGFYCFVFGIEVSIGVEVRWPMSEKIKLYSLKKSLRIRETN